MTPTPLPRVTIQRHQGNVARACTALVLALAIPALQGLPADGPVPGHPAPQFVRPDLQNHSVDLASLRGHVVLLNFWATWCAPCQVEMPRFAAWQAKYGPDGLRTIGISMDDESSPVQALVHKRGIDYPIVMGDEKLGLQYGGVLGLPVTYLIDRHGIIRARYKGETNLDAMETAIRKLLRAP